jgi:hypothetical protein
VKHPKFPNLIYVDRRDAVTTALAHTLKGIGTTRPVAGFAVSYPQKDFILVQAIFDQRPQFSIQGLEVQSLPQTN